MNMISTGAFLNEMDASNKQPTVAEKFAAVWEKKNAKATRAGGVSLMALSLAACGGSSSTTTTTTTTDTTVDTTPVAPAAQSFTLTTGVNTFTGGAGDDTFTGATASTSQSFDTLDGGAGNDTVVLTDIAAAYAGATGIGATVSNMEDLTLSTSGGVGTAAKAASGAVTATAGTAAVDTITYTASTNGGTVSLVVGGQTYSETVAGATDATGASAAAEAVEIINKVLGGTHAVAVAGVVTITSPFKGIDLPTISLAGTGGTGSIASTTPNADTVLASGAQAQTIQFTVGTQTGHSTNNTFAVYVDGVNVGTISGVDTTTVAGQQSIATKLAAALNAATDLGTATAVGNVVTMTAATAGTALPLIGTASTGTTALAITRAETVANADATVAASGAVTEVVFDTSSFTDDVNLTVADNAVVKASATADVVISSSKGSVDVDGGATVNVTGVGAVDVMGDKITSATVKTGTGTGDTVNIGATSGTTADTPILTYAKVTGGTTITISDNKNGTSAKTLTTVDLDGIGGTATITGDAVTTLNVGAQKTSQIINVVNGASTDHTLTLSVADTGIDAAGNAAQVEVNDDTAKTVALTVNGTDNDILLDGDASMTTLTISGAGKAGIALDSTTAVTSIDGSAATGNLDLTGVEAVAVSIKTGSGDDTFTTAATAALTADSGAGNDTVTLGAAVAAGSTVSLGAGNDDLKSSSGSVATDTATKITTIDGGDGSDMVAASLYTSGNQTQFTNFEVLGLDVTGGATFDASLATGVTSLEMLSGSAAVYANTRLTQTLEINENNGNNATTLTFKATDVAGKSDDYTVTFGAKGAAASTAASPTTIDGGTLKIEGVEDLTIVSGQASGFVNNTIDLTSANFKTVTVTGDADTTTIAFAGTNGTNTSATDAAVNLIDMSAVTGDTSLNTTNVTIDNTSTGLTIKGGSGIDTITSATEATIYGGAGADVITVSDDLTTVYLGAGNDTIDVSNSVGVADKIIIMDLAAGDKIDFGTATAFGTTAVDVTAQTTLDGAIGAADATNDKISYFDFGGTTYIVLADNTAGGITGDTIIQLVGDVDLSGATLAANVLTIA